MSRPTKATAGGRAYLDLQNRARREKRPTQELLTLYVLERWLARMAESPYKASFVLKGGLLLSVFNARRPTADADLLAQRLANDEATIVARVREIAETRSADDGVEFLTGTTTAQSIRDDAVYSGVRISMNCLVSTASVKLKLDINVGDPVTPAPRLIELSSQRLDQPPVRLLGYPIETVLAEKISTAIALGEANTRVRDYADLYTLTIGHHPAEAAICAALQATAAHRAVDLRPLSSVIGELGTLRQGTYRAFRQRLGDDGVHLPTDFAEVLSAVVGYVDPLITRMNTES
ncbi:Nucleotidyl transferase AbiEii toxin, Type IV TA system [Amycolatopsis xylanica]|uniref:Nucleotidyl transferase AbiEii toxin, Type IV TA system n=1 Tax=Amycolatopsis xylanica TaxID=589385 RepID=A0A1H3QQA3_9PSEU|nr:nucleotidyl transferase AbiEii/AbiGii toxin family protein [Amycolatopsis xylanica]SDZ15231.1 Nucleotidyl transferase AbiEii toxin, Type IV TA system [Amycolatopsis xylanica]